MKSEQTKKAIYSYIFICIVTWLTISVFFNLPIRNEHIIVLISFLINGFYIFKNLFKSSKIGHSLKDVLYIFMLIFMFLSPVVQYVTNTFSWWNIHLITKEAILYANLLILIFMLTYQISYDKKPKKRKKIASKTEIENIKTVMSFFFIASVIASIFIIYKIEFKNLFSRSTYLININKRSLGLVITTTLRSISVIYVAINLAFIKQKKYIYKKIPFIIGLVLMLLVNFPTATARFWMAAIYLGLFIIVLRKSNNPHFLKLTILLGMLTVFPLINIFRRNSFQEVLALKINIPKVTELFSYGDFDSYSMLTRVIIYTASNGLSFGRQLFGNILFFIPRSIWIEKPIGTGSMIANNLGWQFTNVSCPYIGEGYINFGIIGVIIFAGVLGVLSKKLDNSYEGSIENEESTINYVDIVYPFTLGFLFFILRGDLLSSLSFYIGFMVPIIILFLIQKLQRKIIKNEK